MKKSCCRSVHNVSTIKIKYHTLWRENVHWLLTLGRHSWFIRCNSSQRNWTYFCIPEASEESKRVIAHTRVVKIVFLKNKHSKNLIYNNKYREQYPWKLNGHQKYKRMYISNCFNFHQNNVQQYKNICIILTVLFIGWKGKLCDKINTELLSLVQMS